MSRYVYDDGCCPHGRLHVCPPARPLADVRAEARRNVVEQFRAAIEEKAPPKGGMTHTAYEWCRAILDEVGPHDTVAERQPE